MEASAGGTTQVSSACAASNPSAPRALADHLEHHGVATGLHSLITASALALAAASHNGGQGQRCSNTHMLLDGRGPRVPQTVTRVTCGTMLDTLPLQPYIYIAINTVPRRTNNQHHTKLHTECHPTGWVPLQTQHACHKKHYSKHSDLVHSHSPGALTTPTRTSQVRRKAATEGITNVSSTCLDSTRISTNLAQLHVPSLQSYINKAIYARFNPTERARPWGTACRHRPTHPDKMCGHPRGRRRYPQTGIPHFGERARTEDGGPRPAQRRSCAGPGRAPLSRAVPRSTCDWWTQAG